VFTSNAFAVLGLRALYFVFVDIIDRFTYLKYGIAVMLLFVGVKLLLADVVELPITFSQIVIAGTIGASIGLSFLIRRHEDAA
jgi:tellurite resistance protein TerC